MKINDQLFFVIPLYRDDGTPYAHVHILPISVSAYDVHFNLLIRAYQMMADSGYLAFRSAKRFIRAAAVSIVGQEGADALAQPFLNEVQRLATINLSVGDKWETLPLGQAVAQGLLEPGDADEAVSAACFFSAAWHVPTRRVRASLIDAGTSLWSAHTSSSPPTAPTAGLPTSTATEPTGVMHAPPVPAHNASVTVSVPARRAS